MSAGKDSKAIRSIIREAKSGVHSFSEKFEKKTVFDPLRKKDPELRKANLS